MRLTQVQCFSGPDSNAINATELIQIRQRARNTELKLSNISGVEVIWKSKGKQDAFRNKRYQSVLGYINQFAKML